MDSLLKELQDTHELDLPGLLGDSQSLSGLLGVVGAGLTVTVILATLFPALKKKIDCSIKNV